MQPLIKYVDLPKDLLNVPILHQVARKPMPE